MLLNPVDEVVNFIPHVHNSNDHRFNINKQKEYEGIVSKRGIEYILRYEYHANIVGNRYVLRIKDPDTDRQRYKARYIVQGHQDEQKHNISNNSPVLMRLPLRLIIAMAVIYLDCKLFTRDVEQAYFQGKTLDRPVHTTLPLVANISDEYTLRVTLPHQRLIESSACWFETYPQPLPST